jgi:hypothetical protein
VHRIQGVAQLRKSLIAGVVLVVFFAANGSAVAAPRAADRVPTSGSIMSLLVGWFTGHPAAPTPRKAPRVTTAGACIGNFPLPRFGNCP